LKAGFKGWALVLPLVLVLCVVFSISLNGDVFRGLFMFPDIAELDEPVEDGISPYGTRVAIFGTLLLLIYFGLSLSIANLSRINRPSPPRLVGAGRGQSSDNWESEYGSDIAIQARADWVEGMRWLVGDLGQVQGQEPVQHAEDGRHRLHSAKGHRLPPIPLPLNLLLGPCDLVDLVISVFHLKGGVFRIRYILSIIIVGISCWILSLIM
jgi:hypothetical protein